MNITVYRDQFAELDADRRNNILSLEQYEIAKRELQQSLLQDVDQVTTVAPQTGANKFFAEGVRAAFIVAIALPVSAVLLYMHLGNSQGLLAQQTAGETVIPMSDQQTGVAEQLSPETLQSLVEKLTAHLKSQPSDAASWVRLGQTYAAMKRFKDASGAYARSVALIPNDPSVLADYAEVLGMTTNGLLAGKPSGLIDQALQLDSRHPKALALAGIAAFEQKKFKQAAEYWEQLQAILPVDSEVASSVAKSIAEARSFAASKNITSSAQVGGIQVDGQTRKISSKNTPTTTTPFMGPTLGKISGSVKLAPALAGKISPGDTLYIFARAKEGPKMPLAILRLQAKNLPAAFSLDDTMAMSPAVKLSDFSEVIVGARLSKSGSAMPQSGDLQGFSQAVKIGDQAVSVVIDQQVP